MAVSPKKLVEIFVGLLGVEPSNISKEEDSR